MNTVFFVREDALLKASHYKRIEVKGHLHNGTWVATHSANVLVSDDHDDAKVASGQGSFYQKLAHKKLMSEIDHNTVSGPDHLAAIVLKHATVLQKEASASAAVSGFKASMLAGKVPLPAQYLAMQTASTDVQGKVADACVAAIGAEKYAQLLLAASAKAKQTKGTPSEPTPVKAVETKTQGQVQGATGTPAVEASKPAEVTKQSPTGQATIGVAPAVSSSGGAPVAVSPDAKAKLDSLPWDKLMLADTNSNAAGNNKKIKAIKDAAYAGNVGQLNAMTFGSNNYAKKAALAAKAAIAALTEAAVPAGPKEGDTKTENGHTYKLQGGKWHRQDSPETAGHKAAVAAFAGGSYYQKEALKKLKAEHGPAWDALHPSKQHELAQAKYQSLQGAASQAAAVSGWKKHMLAGQVPTPGEVKAMAAFDAANPKKAVLVMNDVQGVIGLDKYVALVTQAHAKAANVASAPAQAAPAKVFVTTPPANFTASSDPLSDWVALTDKHWGKIQEFSEVAPFLSDPKLAGPAAVMAFASGSYEPINENPNSPESKALLSYLDKLPVAKDKKIHRVLGFMDAAGASAFVSSLMPSGKPNTQDRTLTSWTTKDPAAPGQTPMNNIALDLASIYGDHNVFLTLDGHKTGKDISFVYSKSGTGSGTEVVLSKGAKLEVVGIVQNGKDTHVTVREVQEGDTKTDNGVNYVLQGGVWRKQATAPAAPAAVSPSLAAVAPGNQSLESILMGTDDDILAESIANTYLGDAGHSKLAYEEVIHALDVAGFLPLSNKFVDAKLKAHPAAPAVNTIYQEFLKTNDDVAYFIHSFKSYGKPIAQGKSIDELLEPSAIAAFEALPVGDKVKVGKAIEFYGADKLQLFQTWLAAQNAGAAPAPAAPTKPITVASSVYTNTTAGHNKFWSVSVHGSEMKTTYGKLGSQGTTTTKGFASPAAAVAAANKLKGEKVAKGYAFGYIGQHQYDVPAAPVPSATPAAVPATPTGPQDGDTKMGADGTLVFKNGRWHKEKVAVKKLTQKQINSAIQSVPGVSQNIFSTNKAGKMANAAAKMGDAKKIIEAYQLSESLGFPKTMGHIKAVAAAMGVTVGAGSPTVPAAAAASPAGAAAANNVPNSQNVVFTTAPTAANPTVSAPTVKVVAGKPPVTVIDGWPQTGPQKGSNPGGKFKDKNGQEWYCKFPADVDVAMNELLAAKFYEMLGVSVPNLKLVEQGGKVGIASKWVDGMTKGTAAQLGKAKGGQDAFALDAWLANWDVVGLSNDNLMLGKDGAAVHVDVGGSLVYRAQGGKKGADFGDTVPELESLLDPHKNANSAAVFAGMTPDKMAWGLGQLNKMKPSQIEELCQKVGPGSDADKAALAKKLIARRAFILAKFGIDDQWSSVVKLDPSNLPVNPADLPAPIDFANYNGVGVGLSSKAHVNAKNTLDSANMIAFASKGNLTALKNYMYDAVDKDTGASLGKKSIIDHPSQQVKAQWAGLVETLQSISTPSPEILKMPSLGAAGSEAEISALAGTFEPTDRVETVAPESRFGFFMAVSHIDDIQSLLSQYKWSFLTPASKVIQDAKTGFNKMSGAVRAYISAVQASGWINHVWSQGKATVDADGNGGKYSGGVHTLASKIYADAMEIPAGTTLMRGMSDTTAGKSMTKLLLSAKPGLVIQNTDSMCTSYKEGWGGFNGGIMLTIRCGEGCKGTPSFASGAFKSENEITTLPGQRFVVLSSEKKGSVTHVELFMLPPHDGYVAELGKLETLGKAIVVFFKRGM